MNTVRVTYYGNKQNKKVAIFKVKENDTLELLETKDYVSPIVSPELLKSNNRTPFENNKIKIGIGEVIASFTKLFGFKPCAPCNKRRRYLNEKTPVWMANIIAKFYK
jgi:hypothetical protein